MRITKGAHSELCPTAGGDIPVGIEGPSSPEGIGASSRGGVGRRRRWGFSEALAVWSCPAGGAAGLSHVPAAAVTHGSAGSSRHIAEIPGWRQEKKIK